MDTTKQSISSASFIGHICNLLVTKLQNKEVAKTVSFILVVALCTIIRYVAVSTDKNFVEKNDRTVFTVNCFKLPIWPPELILKSKRVKKQINYEVKLQDVKFIQTDKAFYSFVKD